VEEITDADFYEKTAEGLSLVLFYKEACPYCKTMKGVMEKFGAKNPSVKLLQIDGLKHTRFASELGVERSPDLIFFKDGKPTAARQKGLTNPQGLTELLQTI